jgi:hypothetical protein
VISKDRPLLPKIEELSDDKAFHVTVSAHAECLIIIMLMRNLFPNCRKADRQDKFTVLYRRLTPAFIRSPAEWRPIVIGSGDESTPGPATFREPHTPAEFVPVMT